MKKQPRKLHIDKITIRTLVPSALTDVVGGSASTTTATTFKQSFDKVCQSQ